MKDNKSTIENDITLIKFQVTKMVNEKNMLYGYNPPQKFIKACQYIALNGKLIDRNTDTSLHDFYEALIRQSNMILDSYGVIIKQEEVRLNYMSTINNDNELYDQIGMSIFYIAHVVNMFAEKYDRVDDPVSIDHGKVKITWTHIINELAIEQSTHPYMLKVTQCILDKLLI